MGKWFVAELRKRAVGYVFKLVEMSAAWCCGHFWPYHM